MISSWDTFLCTCIVVIVAGFSKASPETFNSVSSSDGSTSRVSKRGWSMLRLGRGLQMLRLGKRNGLETLRLGRQVVGDDEPSIPWDRLSADELGALLAAFTQPRDHSRRQPPLPRYGRQITSTARDLLDILAGESVEGDDSSDDTGVLFRHPPRGGRRFKRSLNTADVFNPYDSYMLAAGPFMGRNYRAVALPRYGRYSFAAPRLQTKAVPRPRIGKSLQDQDLTVDADSKESSSN